MRLRQPYLLVLLLFITFSCDEQNRSVNEIEDFGGLSTTRLLPKQVKLNLDEGYAISKFSGDSIFPMINSLGTFKVTTHLRLPLL